jgi:hypothetical protein
MIWRTSCAQRHAAAILAAQACASSREETSIIENPPITGFVSFTGPAEIMPSVPTTVDCWRSIPQPKIQISAAFAAPNDLVCCLAHRWPVFLRNMVHRAVIKRNQVR